ncbi:hypothetical protein [Citrobacter sp. JGM124]|uniref:hypothetical protein n=1 Tax=Citrobacter sp. JGM124 TaxID=2799789 RepID=UPI001BAB6437|nr:hypothetical protein [Citrobacter sp. JGM124]MBS0849275.1 hypothetical protein [Citrobacter sp. JGM124]
MKAVTLSILFSLLTVSGSAMADWPPEDSAKVPGNTLELPTTLKPVEKPLDQLLNEGGAVISAQHGKHGPVVTLKKGDQYIMCLLIGAGDGGDQNISTSRCYALN